MSEKWKWQLLKGIVDSVRILDNTVNMQYIFRIWSEPPWMREYSPTPEEILLASLPDKPEIKNPILLTQRKPKSEKPGWPSKRLLITEPPWKRVYSPTPEEILLANLPDKREIKNSVLLTQRKPKSEKPGWPSNRLLLTEPPWKREYSPTPEEILLATLPEEKQQEPRFIGNQIGRAVQQECRDRYRMPS